MKLQKDDRVYIKTKSGGRIAMNNLRPGDWLKWRKLAFVIIQNSAVLSRAEIMYPGGRTAVYSHTGLGCLDEAHTYLGRGKKRWWYDRLPRFLKRYFMPYSKPE